MWVCPKCGCENYGDYCTECKASRPYDASQQTAIMDYNNYNLQKKNGIDTYLIIVALVIVFIVIFSIICVVALNNNNYDDNNGFSVSDIINSVQEAEKKEANPKTKKYEKPATPVPYEPMKIEAIYGNKTKNGDNVIIETNSYAEPQVMNLSNPSRLVLDFYGHSLGIGGSETNTYGNCYKNIRYANHDDYARVVIDLTTNCKYVVHNQNNICTVKLVKESVPTIPTAVPTTAPTAKPTPTAVPQDMYWKKAFLKCVNKSSSYIKFKLLYIDNDDIPELYMVGDCLATGDLLCVYNPNTDKVFEAELLNYSLYYVPNSSYFMEQGGHMDQYQNNIYTIINYMPSIVHAGSFGAIDNSSVQFDENGDPIYQYFWDGYEVSKEEYESKLNSSFDMSISKHASKSCVSRDEIIRQLTE